MRVNRLPLVILIGMTACQGWRSLARPVPSGTLEGNPEVVRVTRTMGCGPTPSRACMENRSKVTLYNPRIQGDSLIGYFDQNNRERGAVAVNDIVSVEAQKVDKLRTTGAVVGSTVVIVAVLSVLLAVAALSALY